MNGNDELIIKLKEKIKTKKKELKEQKGFMPKTNCSIGFGGNNYNINVLNYEDLLNLLIKINSFALSAEDLDLRDKYVISGYHVDEWLSDIKNKMAYLNKRNEEGKLKAMEKQLNTLLSQDKKTELEIAKIAKLLK